MRKPPRADIDRLVSLRDGGAGQPERLSGYRGKSRLVLLGEPGSGKSTAFGTEAEAAGTRTVTARRFVAGDQPPGDIVFIDALEEFRIGEAGLNRLASLVDAVTASSYSGWRIACRAISLPPSDALRVEEELGAFEILQLEPLDTVEQLKILDAFGEPDPSAFIDKVAAMGANALLGNPSTLLLLRRTLANTHSAVRTRGALLAEATRQMGHEINPMMPVRDDRPMASEVIAAAEAACLVLLLSTREDIWMHGTPPPSADYVTRDDLLPAQVDTQALRAALDSPMFTGDGETFMPAHRFVAEYLAGRALAAAVAPDDPHRPALPLDRAIAFLSGDNDRPAPAMTGVYAWFATALAGTIHFARALELVERDPEAVLFHGDAAMLPTEHRRALLAAMGRDDPWFLRGKSGSTVLGGLAGDDLAAEMKAILEDPDETPHRRALVLMALAEGQPVTALEAPLSAIFLNEQDGHGERRYAFRALANIMGRRPETYRGLLDSIKDHTSTASVELRIELLALLMPNVASAEVRGGLEAYGRTSRGAMGYARPLARRLELHPMPDLFDTPFETKRHGGQERYHEAASVVDAALAAAIRQTEGLDAERLLTWLKNTDVDDMSDPHDGVRDTILQWIDKEEGRDLALFEGIRARHPANEGWMATHHYRQLTGREAPVAAREQAVAAVQAAQDEPSVRAAAALAFPLVTPFERHEALYWRMWHALDRRRGGEEVFDALTLSPVDAWQSRNAKRERQEASKREERRARAVQWFLDGLPRIAAGQTRRPAYSAEVYLGYHDAKGETGPERLQEWFGQPHILAAIRAGWEAFTEAYLPSPFEAGRLAGANSVPASHFIALCLADARLLEGSELKLSPAALLHVAAAAYALQPNRAEAVRKAAIDELRGEEGIEALLAFWNGAAAGGATDLLLSRDVDPHNTVIRSALERLLRRRPVLRESLLRDALERAAKALPPAILRDLAAVALSRPLPFHARRLWSFAAWALGEDAMPQLFDCEFAAPGGHEAFASLSRGPLGKLLSGDVAISRLEVVIAALAPVYPPPDRFPGYGDAPADVVSKAIERLSASALPSATTALERLTNSAAPAWRDDIASAAAQQRTRRREAEFKPPAPRKVAAALTGGPPATPADLRAIVGECLRELAHDIRHGDTSPWKGFWNRPSSHGSENTPKVENDCRDLLTDRLRDRLMRFGIGAHQVQTEDRSENDRRADAAIVLGNGAAAVPIEAKRHWNPELWTAINNQLVPYCTSAGSNGHGIYLVFWFGPKWKTPTPPMGRKQPETAAELQALLVETVPHRLAASIEILVVDVSEPEKPAE